MPVFPFAADREHSPAVRQRPDSHIPEKRYDVVIVGAGIGGLSAAALLAHGGMRVLLLEKIHYPGGCASSYDKFGARFDVGATTFSGVAPTQPLADLFARIGTFDGLLPADPAMGIAIDGRIIRRHRARAAWIEEAERQFDLPMGAFWTEISDYSDAAYAAMSAVPHLPPQSVAEAAQCLPHLPRELLRHVPHLFSTIQRRMRRHGVDNSAFRRFIDAQLLITSQAHSGRVPFFAGALGLSYPDYPVYSVRGGMISYARFLEERARCAGAHIVYLQAVTGIERRGAEWRVHTRSVASVDAGAVVTNVPVFNLPSMTSGKQRAHFERSVERVYASGVHLWGAYTIYGLVDREIGKDLPINMQVILPTPLKQTGSTTLFLSFSHPDDESRAPAGMRTLTISTHISPKHPALGADRMYYQSWKNAANSEILLALQSHVPEFGGIAFHHSQSGTPLTFERYTGRTHGIVGGIPLDHHVFPFRYPMPSPPFDGLHCIGDTFFPGQGIPGVTLGALAVGKRLGVFA